MCFARSFAALSEHDGRRSARRDAHTASSGRGRRGVSGDGRAHQAVLSRALLVSRRLSLRLSLRAERVRGRGKGRRGGRGRGSEGLLVEHVDHGLVRVLRGVEGGGGAARGPEGVLARLPVEDQQVRRRLRPLAHLLEGRAGRLHRSVTAQNALHGVAAAETKTKTKTTAAQQDSRTHEEASVRRSDAAALCRGKREATAPHQCLSECPMSERIGQTSNDIGRGSAV